MARIPMMSGFQVLPEGDYIFQITDVEYKEAFGKLSLKMVTNTGKKHIENFTLMKQDGSWNEGALAAFSITAKAALNRMDAPEGEEVDPSELVGKFFSATVEHDVQPNKNDPTKTVTWVRLNNKKPSAGFGTGNVKPDLKSLLG